MVFPNDNRYQVSVTFADSSTWEHAAINLHSFYTIFVRETQAKGLKSLQINRTFEEYALCVRVHEVEEDYDYGCKNGYSVMEIYEDFSQLSYNLSLQAVYFFIVRGTCHAGLVSLVADERYLRET